MHQFGLTDEGDAKGLLSLIFKVDCEYDPAGSAGPSTFIAKLTPPEFGARLFGRLFCFETEVEMYKKKVLMEATISTPDCYFAEYDRLSGDVAIFLEDMTPRATVDQLTGWTEHECKGVLVDLARLHARFWGSCASEPLLSSWRFVSFDNPQLCELGKDMYQKNAETVIPTVRAVGGFPSLKFSLFYQCLNR